MGLCDKCYKLFTWEQEEISLRYKNQTKAALNCWIWHNPYIISLSWVLMKQKEGKNEAQTAKTHFPGEQFPSEPANSRIMIRTHTLTLPMNGNIQKSYFMIHSCGPCGFASFCYKETKVNLRREEGRTQNQEMKTHPPCTHRQSNRFFWIYYGKEP